MWTRWNTHTVVSAEPAEVIEVLTCVDAIRDWSPVTFDLDDCESHRLHTGTHDRVVPLEDGASVEAAVSVRSRGGTGGRIVARAVNALLAAGALDRALARIS